MPSDSSLNSKLNTSSPGGWQAFSWSRSTRRLVADGNATRRFRPSEVRSLRSPRRHASSADPTDRVRSRQTRVYRKSNRDALIEAFLNSNLVEPARSLFIGACSRPSRGVACASRNADFRRSKTGEMNPGCWFVTCAPDDLLLDLPHLVVCSCRRCRKPLPRIARSL